MTAYKVNTQESRIEPGRLLVEFNGIVILLATPTLPTQFFSKFTFERIRQMGWVDLVVLEDEKWVLPHLYKPVRLELDKAA